MRSNPFYALSAAAMLLGCWLLGEALELEAGKLAGLVVLMLVLQVYELLLTGLGVHLVRSGRAPRDGVVVLVVASVFLMNATNLSAECAAADLRLGTLVTLGAAVLGALKLWWVRRACPELLSKRAAITLGAHALAVLALPVVAAQVASGRVMGPAALYLTWWTTAALPLAQTHLFAGTQWHSHRAPRAHARWTWMPCGMVLLQLWSVGYVHTVDFRLAFLTPFLLALALRARPEHQRRKIALPLLAVFCSLFTGEGLVLHLLGPHGPAVSPLGLALVAGSLVWLYLGWRDRDPWLAGLPMLGGALWLGGSSAARLARTVAGWLVDGLPRDRFSWGTLTVIAAFVLLAAGLRRSLQGDPRWPRRPPTRAGHATSERAAPRE